MNRNFKHFLAYLLAVLSFLPGLVTPAAAQDRPKVGVAFGGGSARGIAHVGVIRWFEEHHIPIDLAAGTSMGGLIGGSFATGMNADEIQAMLRGIDWDEMFGASNYAFKNIRRKIDARAYPSRLEFGLKKGLQMPTALNNGEQVDLLITRITSAYYGAPTFDALPTPFRVVAVDLKTAQAVVIDRGVLGTAMRATMSLPGIFPPIELDGRVLVDGGAMNNVPADVVRNMGAQRVVAVNVGDLGDQEAISSSMLGLMGATLDAMMRANTKKALPAADVVLNVPLKEFGSLDWRKSDALIEAGYQAAEAMKAQLLPYAVSDAEWQRWLDGRAAARKTTLPVPAFVTLEGVGASDQRRMSELLSAHVGKPLDIPALETSIEALSGLDRYETIHWRFTTNAAGETGILIRAREKPYAPPFLMMGLNLENTTSDQFQLSLTARYLNFDVVGSGSELRVDGTIGADPGLAAALYQPVWRATFVAPFAGVSNHTFNVTDEGAIVARYTQTYSNVGVDLGINVSRDSDLRLGAAIGRLNADVKIGDPGLPSVDGKQTSAHLAWRLDNSDSAVVPSRGTRAHATFTYIYDGPNVTVDGTPIEAPQSSLKLPQLDGEANHFWSPGTRNRVFLLGGFGTSFDHHPLPIDQYPLGAPLHLGAYNFGEVLGDHYVLGTVGYLRELGRMPDFLGGSIFAGAWLENGDAFDDWGDATLRTHASGGVIMDTLIGPVILAGSAGFDGRWRTYIGVGRLFR